MEEPPMLYIQQRVIGRSARIQPARQGVVSVRRLPYARSHQVNPRGETVNVWFELWNTLEHEEVAEHAGARVLPEVGWEGKEVSCLVVTVQHVAKAPYKPTFSIGLGGPTRQPTVRPEVC